MSEPSAYGALALGRAKEMPVRFAFATFIGAAAWVFTQQPGPVLTWFALMTVAQIIDSWVASPMRLRPHIDPSMPRKVVYGCSIALAASIYSSICLHMWFNGGQAGQAFAMIVPAGSVLNLSLQMKRGQRALMAGWIPHAVWLLALPLISGVVTPQQDLFAMSVVSLGGALYLVHVSSALRRLQNGAKKLRDAHDAAEIERARAERANAAKSDFLATISHEIRTPMNAVVAAGGLLRRTELTGEQASHVSMLEDFAEILMGLLNDVLDLSKIESGRLDIECAPVELVKKLQAAASLWRPRAEQKGVTLVFDPAGLPERIMSDPLRLQQVVVNLLSNAVKFTDAGEVRLHGGCKVDGETELLWLEVEDTGCGMTAEIAERVFESFEQASAETARRHGGTGLGLSISRRLAGMLGGTLTVRSGEGQGSVFRLTIPLELAEAPVAVAADAVTQAKTNEARSGARVLVADDHEVNQRVLKLILEPLGFEIALAGNGREAVDLAAREPFDVIIMDMQMPIMGGVEAASLIKREDGHNRATPIIALTANALQEHREQWTRIGVDMFMTKPVDMKALIETVEMAIGLRGLEPAESELAAAG